MVKYVPFFFLSIASFSQFWERNLDKIDILTLQSAFCEIINIQKISIFVKIGELIVPKKILLRNLNEHHCKTKQSSNGNRNIHRES